MQLMHKDVQRAVPLQGPSTDTYGRTAVLLPRLWQQFHDEFQPEEAFAYPHGRKTAPVRHLLDDVQQDVQPQVAQAKAAHKRAALQVPGLPEEVCQRRQTTQTLEDDQLRAQQRRRTTT